MVRAASGITGDVEFVSIADGRLTLRLVGNFWHNRQARTHKHARAHTHAHTHTRTRARAHANLNTHTHTHIHARAHTRTHTHTHTRTDAGIAGTAEQKHLPGGPAAQRTPPAVEVHGRLGSLQVGGADFGFAAAGGRPGGPAALWRSSLGNRRAVSAVCCRLRSKCMADSGRSKSAAPIFSAVCCSAPTHQGTVSAGVVCCAPKCCKLGHQGDSEAPEGNKSRIFHHAPGHGFGRRLLCTKMLVCAQNKSVVFSSVRFRPMAFDGAAAFIRLPPAHCRTLKVLIAHQSMLFWRVDCTLQPPVPMQ